MKDYQLLLLLWVITNLHEEDQTGTDDKPDNIQGVVSDSTLVSGSWNRANQGKGEMEGKGEMGEGGLLCGKKGNNKNYVYWHSDYWIVFILFD